MHVPIYVASDFLKIKVIIYIYIYTMVIAGYKGSSDLYIDSNIQLAIAAAKKIFSGCRKKVHILLPDNAEYRRAYRL